MRKLFLTLIYVGSLASPALAYYNNGFTNGYEGPGSNSWNNNVSNNYPTYTNTYGTGSGTDYSSGGYTNTYSDPLTQGARTHFNW